MTFLNLEIQRLTREKYKLNLEIPKPNQGIFWNKKPKEIRSENMECLTLPYKNLDNLNSFKLIIKCWDGNHCTVRVCEHTTSRQ